MVEKTLRYTTLKGLISKTSQYSLNTFLSGRMYHNKKGHIKIKLTEKLTEQINSLFGGFLNRNISYNKGYYGIFDRLIINKRNLEVQYIAGQDYTAELRTLRGCFR